MQLLKNVISFLLISLALAGLSLPSAAWAQIRSPFAGATLARNVQIRTITVQELPPEARKTITLIKQGGPFPYEQDGVIFGNRERILPIEPRGYYREYTVRTPGSFDRGARRIVTGRNGEFFYTNDHYKSFFRVRMP